MTLPIGAKIRVRRHWLVEGFTGAVVDHRKGDLRSPSRNEVLLSEPWVPNSSSDPEFCRRMFFSDHELEVLSGEARKSDS